ncbi:TetR/AcrR family transcriptional regulator [bacterium]|nr:TetR/AcrR family transcriptional regulator [bacterium]
MSKPESEARQRILQVAEKHFMQRGYAVVRLREIAEELDLKHTAIYYHFKSKEALFMEVMEQSLLRHQTEMEAAIADAGTDLREQLRAVTRWLMDNPPLNFMHLVNSDFAELGEANARYLSDLAFKCLRQPLEDALTSAQERGVVELRDPGLASIMFVSLVEMVHAFRMPEIASHKTVIVDNMIEMMLNGWLKR